MRLLKGGGRNEFRPYIVDGNFIGGHGHCGNYMRDDGGEGKIGWIGSENDVFDGFLLEKLKK
jgi:hypothetical protein